MLEPLITKGICLVALIKNQASKTEFCYKLTCSNKATFKLVNLHLCNKLSKDSPLGIFTFPSKAK